MKPLTPHHFQLKVGHFEEVQLKRKEETQKLNKTKIIWTYWTCKKQRRKSINNGWYHVTTPYAFLLKVEKFEESCKKEQILVKKLPTVLRGEQIGNKEADIRNLNTNGWNHWLHITSFWKGAFWRSTAKRNGKDTQELSGTKKIWTDWIFKKAEEKLNQEWMIPCYYSIRLLVESGEIWRRMR